VSRVELLTGEPFRRAQADKRWSGELVTAAISTEQRANFERQAYPGRPPGKASLEPRHALIVTYKDGTRATILAIGNTADRWDFACRLRGRSEVLSTALFNGPWGNLCLFTALSNAVAHFFRTGKAPYPIERTLLVSGILDAAMHSAQARGKPVETPQLEFGYSIQDFSTFRETGESWRIITKDTPQPTTLEPYHE
jgi:hypothetical protein